MKKEINSPDLPKEVGPYSNGVSFKDLIFASGQLPIDSKTGNIPEDIKGQTKQALENLMTLLKAAGSSSEKVLKCTVYLKNLDDFPGMNEVYTTFFSKPFPARVALQIGKLPMDVLVEIDAIAYI